MKITKGRQEKVGLPEEQAQLDKKIDEQYEGRQTSGPTIYTGPEVTPADTDAKPTHRNS